MEVDCWCTAESLRFSPAYPPLCCGYGDDARLSHQRPGQGEGHTKHILVYQPLFLGRVGFSHPQAQVGRYIGVQDLHIFRGHESADGEAEGFPYRRLVQSKVPDRGEADTNR